MSGSESRRPSSQARNLCLAGTLAVAFFGIAYFSADDGQIQPQPLPEAGRLQAFHRKSSIKPLASVKEVLSSSQLSSQSLASAIASGWTLRERAGRYDVFRSEQYPQVLLGLHVEEGHLKEVCLVANRLNATEETRDQIAGTASRFVGSMAAADSLQNWLKSSWATSADEAAYWAGADAGPFKAFCFTKELVSSEELTEILQDKFQGRTDAAMQELKTDAQKALQVVGVYLYPAHQAPPASHGSLQEIGLDFREPIRRMACRIHGPPTGASTDEES